MKRRDFLKATSLAIALGAVNPVKSIQFSCRQNEK